MRQYTYSNSRSKRTAHSTSPGFKTILLVYVLPFLLINGLIFFFVTVKPKYTVTVGETTDYTTTSMTLKIKSILPTRNLSVALNGEPLELEETDKKTYTAPITVNGTIEVYLESFNGMAVITYEHVNILDDEPPIIDDYSVEDGILTITLSDSQSGIDFNSIHAINSAGEIIQPLSMDKLNYTASFPADPNGLTLYVSDISGHTTEQPFSITEKVEGADGETGAGSDAGFEGIEESSAQ